ncbi:MAG TPA: AbrB family transcriptional regulator [Kiloniellaceae bacterium]
MSLRRLIELGLCYGVASGAGYLFSRLDLPLPWMIGPLIATALIGLVARPIDIPTSTRPVGQLMVSAHVGLSFNAAALAAIVDHGLVILSVAVATGMIGFLMSGVLRRMTGTDHVTAFLASMPGGPVEMGNLARQYGGDPGPVIFAQTLRISTIVILVPAALYYLLHETRGSLPDAAFVPDFAGMALLAAGAAATAALFRLCRISNPFFLGPLAFSCVATVLGLPLAPFPDAVVSFAQILLGTWLGSTFRRELFLNAGRLVVAITVTSMLLVALCTAFAASLALVTDFPWQILVLGAAPGSITEMALTARFLRQDVALITAFHLVRIFLIIPTTPWMLALVHARSAPPAATAKRPGGREGE